jgi:3-phosphoshikimate 1-carboxyvinyltransferase
LSLHVRAAGRALRGELAPPGDKSITHRALIFASLADGVSRLQGLLDAADTRATRNALEQLGARFEDTAAGVRVAGLGGRPGEPEAELDMGNSGTAMRLLAGVLAGQGFDSTLVGDASLSRRPMRRIIRPLQQMGAVIECTPEGTAPLRIRGRALSGIRYRSPVASAQVKSCVLLAGLYAAGESCVREPRLSRDHTERMLPVFGVTLPRPCCVMGGSRLRAADLRVPADPSSAAFMAVAALLIEGSEVVLRDVGLNRTRTGFFRALEAMGADIEIAPQADFGGEPVGTVRVRHSPGLQGLDLPEEWIPSMIDEIPALMAVAARAEGVTRVRGAAELRVKESDRLAVMSCGLRAMGVEVRELPDGFDIAGPARLGHAVVDGKDDHRCAMSFAVLGLAAEGGATVRGADFIDTSYPGFAADLRALGAELTPQNDTS